MTKICRFVGQGCPNGEACPFAHDTQELRLHRQAVDSGAISLLSPLLGFTLPGIETDRCKSDLSTNEGWSGNHFEIWKDSHTVSASVQPSGRFASSPSSFDRSVLAGPPGLNGCDVQRGTPLSKDIGADGRFHQHDRGPHFPYGATSGESTSGGSTSGGSTSGDNTEEWSESCVVVLDDGIAFLRPGGTFANYHAPVNMQTQLFQRKPRLSP